MKGKGTLHLRASREPTTDTTSGGALGVQGGMRPWE